MVVTYRKQTKSVADVEKWLYLGRVVKRHIVPKDKNYAGLNFGTRR